MILFNIAALLNFVRMRARIGWLQFLQLELIRALGHDSLPWLQFNHTVHHQKREPLGNDGLNLLKPQR